MDEKAAAKHLVAQIDESLASVSTCFVRKHPHPPLDPNLDFVVDTVIGELVHIAAN